MTPEFGERKNIFKVSGYHAHAPSRLNNHTQQQHKPKAHDCWGSWIISFKDGES
jgi:hypothetical protein